MSNEKDLPKPKLLFYQTPDDLRRNRITIRWVSGGEQVKHDEAIKELNEHLEKMNKIILQQWGL